MDSLEKRKLPLIITISGKAQHGKDTCCNLMIQYLQEMGKTPTKIAYADYLKDVCTRIYGWNGEKDEIGRTILQQVGTEQARSVNPDIWVEVVAKTAEILIDKDVIIIPDTRFSNEITYWMVSDFPYISTKVIRADFDNGLTQEQKAHRSETALDYWSTFDFEFQNFNNDIKPLEKQIKNFVYNLPTLLYSSFNYNF